MMIIDKVDKVSYTNTHNKLAYTPILYVKSNFRKIIRKNIIRKKQYVKNIEN